ncbi:hypothetical protein ACIQU6_43090, partial [Streptomyces sp. NPDC090442]|uniref:hypothetical protein n=1 Tax=Streptomyces sp. NPDC090442 TaxID=3365962 RepID=UPI0038101F2D
MTAATNKVEALNGFSDWARFGQNGTVAANDPSPRRPRPRGPTPPTGGHTMTPADAAELLSLCAAFDRRTIGEADAHAWARALHDVPLDEDTRTAVAE